MPTRARERLSLQQEASSQSTPTSGTLSQHGLGALG